MRFHKIISTILHPIVIPTLGILLYFIFVSHNIPRQQQLLLLGLIFVITYAIPLLLLIILKALGFVKDFQVTTIKERRFPVIFMIILFYLLGNTISRVPVLRDIGFLFYGTSLSLFCIYLLFMFRLKSSLHLVSLGNAVGFFIIVSSIHSMSLLPVIMVLILLSGLLASSRLHLNAHTPKELLWGFSLGLISQITIIFIL
ncbi:MAG: hypothetical protein JKY02_09055 [Flavobacteriaceae bacterium]|nr:hypothetical protein [Flavobacteriaceae bacterium]